MADDEQRRQFTGGSSKILVLRAVEKRKRAEVIRVRKDIGCRYPSRDCVSAHESGCSQARAQPPPEPSMATPQPKTACRCRRTQYFRTLCMGSREYGPFLRLHR